MKLKAVFAKRKSSELRLILSFIVISFVASAIIVAQIFAAREQTENEVKRTLLNYSAVAENMVSSSLQRVDDTLFSMAMDLGEHPERMTQKYLQKLLREKEVHSDIPGLAFRIINAQGESVVGTNDIQTGRLSQSTNFKDRSFFKAVKRGAARSLSEPIKSKSLDRWQIVLARRISDKDGRFLGSMGAALDVEYIARIATTFQLGPTDVFAIFTGDEPRALARYPELQGFMGAPFKYHPLFEKVAKGELHTAAHETVSPIDGVLRYTAMTKIERFPILFVTGRGLDAQLASWWNKSLLALSILLLTIAAGASMIWRFVKSNRLLSEQQLKLLSSSKMALLGEMAGGVAHEINNPLTVVYGRAYEIRRLARADVIDRKQLERTAENIEMTAMRMAKITRGLRSFAREGDKDPFTTTPLSTIINDTLGFCQARFKHHSIELRVQSLPETLQIECRSVQISQVLLNLLGNAFDAVETLDEKWVAIEAEDLGNAIELSVTDSGRGIPRECRDKILQPFFTTKSLGKGTGLGLSISKGIVESHQGHLFLDESSTNTRFVVRLPKLQREREAASFLS